MSEQDTFRRMRQSEDARRAIAEGQAREGPPGLTKSTPVEHRGLLPHKPRRKCFWGMRLYVDDKPSAWLSRSYGGLQRWGYAEQAGLMREKLRNGDWRVEKIPLWLALLDTLVGWLARRRA
jgi:hypothetical protein